MRERVVLPQVTVDALASSVDGGPPWGVLNIRPVLDSEETQ